MRPIQLDDATKAQLIASFTEKLNTLRNDSKSISCTFNLTKIYEQRTTFRPTVIFDPEAYLRILAYVLDTDTEIAWHGTVTRDYENNVYRITEVFLYPQTLRATTVTTDQDKYNTWLEELPDDIFNSMRMQGHSHVNFSVTPSGTDTDYYNAILQTLPDNDYYIFMIINKRRELTLMIYDLATNTIYDTADIDIRIGDRDSVLPKDIKTEKDLFCDVPKYPSYNYGYGSTAADDYFDSLDKKTYEAPKPLATLPKNSVTKTVKKTKKR